MKKYLASLAWIGLILNHYVFAGSVSIYTDPQYRYIKSDGLPNHSHGQFPNSGNPNTISAQNYEFKVTLHPKEASYVTQLRNSQYFGVALNGVPFDPGTAEYWQGNRNWRYEALTGQINLGLDSNNAHVQHSGAYHYHGIPSKLVNKLNSGSRLSLVGWAADGFPIYYDNQEELTSSYHIKSGQRRGNSPTGAYDGRFTQDYEYRKGSGQLDECNGTYGKTDEFPNGTYFYVLTKSFPSVPRCFKGKPNQSFSKHDGMGPPGQGPEHHRPPPPHHWRQSQFFKFFGYTKVI